MRPLFQLLTVPALILGTSLLSACGSMGAHPHASAYSQQGLPPTIQVPTGNKVAWETVGKGSVTYECRDKAGMAGQTEWVFAGPDAVLSTRDGKAMGKYYGPPATWEAMDGSKVTGTQLAVAPAGTGNLPFQLVKANPAMGSGAMTGVTYIQRVALAGGVAPASGCSVNTKGQRQTVQYQADYIFWKAS
jgi:hypothetical protein